MIVMIKFSNWVIVSLGSIAAFSCSTTKEITVNSDKVELQSAASIPSEAIENERVKTVSFASIDETTDYSEFQEMENPPLFKAIPDSVLEYLPTIAEQRQSLEEDEALVNADPPTEPIRNPNYYARWSLAFGLIGFFTAISIWGPLIFGTLAIVYAKKSKQYKEPNQKKARAGRFWGIASFIAIPLSITAVLILEYIFFF